MSGASPPLSVVVPTIGRVELLERCLRSILACEPPPAEVVVVDQSAGDEVRSLATALQAPPLRVVTCPGRGIPLAVNTGLREARQPLVAVTHDDCTVDRDWVAAAAEALARHPGELITGRVTPVGDPRAVPSTRDEIDERVYDQVSDVWALLPNNMAVDRRAFVAFGGFDERFDRAGEDMDAAFRWLRAGGVVRFVPAMRAWHHDWRTPRMLRRTWVSYSRGCGIFFAKYLLEPGHRRLMLGLLRADLRDFAGALRATARTGRVPWWDPRYGTFPGIPIGLVVGLRRFARR